MTEETPVPPATLSVSNSEIQSWKSCRRKWYIGFYLQVGPHQTGPRLGPLGLGTKIHLALQARYERHENAVARVRMIYEQDIAQWPNQEEALRKEMDLAVAMLEGYEIWLEETGADQGLTIVATESVIEAPSPVPGVNIKGKLDMRLYRDLDGARIFLDHKSLASFTPGSILAIDEQMKFYTFLEYMDAMMKTGEGPAEPTDGGIYNMLRKVKRTARAKPPFYERVEVRYNTHVLRSMWLRTKKVLEEIVDARARLDAGEDHQYVVYPRPSKDCSWACEHVQLCPMMDDGSNWQGMIAEHYEHVDPYERYSLDGTDGAIE